jgi:hypothetical protein
MEGEEDEKGVLKQKRFSRSVLSVRISNNHLP